MSKYIIYIIIIINIIGIINNKSCMNCNNKQKTDSNFKKIIIIFITSFLGLIIILIILILFVRKYVNYLPQYTISHSNLKTKEKINLEKKLVYLLHYEIKGESYIKEYENEKCTICLEKIKKNDEVCLTLCKHLFHFICLKLYILDNLNSKCPLCKYDFLEMLKDKKIDFQNIQINYEQEKKMLEHYKQINKIEPDIINVRTFDKDIIPTNVNTNINTVKY